MTSAGEGSDVGSRSDVYNGGVFDSDDRDLAALRAAGPRGEGEGSGFRVQGVGFRV